MKNRGRMLEKQKVWAILFILSRDLGFKVTSSNVVKCSFGFSTLTAHNVIKKSIMINLPNYSDQLFLKISLH
jgi:hypothetical protein